MPHPDFPNLTVLAHPLIQHKLTILRDRRTSTRDFKQLVNEIAMLMAYEVTQDLPLESVEIDTPLEPMRGVQVAGEKLTLVPILRPGLGAAPEGVLNRLAAHAEVPVYTAALDRQLNERGYILPGLGDAGDRLFGTGRG